MWRVTLILNALLMVVFSLGSGASQIKLRNQYIQYPHVGQNLPPLPPISDFALRAQWLLTAVPLVWALLTLALLIVNWKRPESPTDMVQFHTTATVLVGLSMLVVFVTAGVMPYVTIVVHMR